ncbi:MAG: DUF1232 domain-containing protein [Deltaproteobacteria bacterium]|nr:MAG: DUF1232 domain-containing protein [Deltaproteobacteria bacterium]
MASKSFRVTFSLDESDVAYFRRLYQTAKKNAPLDHPERVVNQVRDTVSTVRERAKLPKFVAETISTLETLIQMLEDEDYALPRTVASRVVAALAYFADAEDLIPDHLPALGFLDDAIMVKFVEQELRDELSAYRKFRKFREGAEQRPWTRIARERLPRRLEEYRKRLRSEIQARKQNA